MATVQDQIKALENPENTEIELKLEILRQLPETIPAPSISNINTKGRWGEYAHLSFSAPAYDPEKTFDPGAVLAAMEQAGWFVVPATLVQKDDYRPSPEPGTQDDIPEQIGHYTVTATWPICPVWVVPCQFCNPDARCFMRSPDGQVFDVSIDIPKALCGLQCDRREYRGGWNFKGPAVLRFPEHWRTVADIAVLHEKTRAFKDTEHGISGVIYWEPTQHDHAAFPMTASYMLKVLLS